MRPLFASGELAPLLDAVGGLLLHFVWQGAALGAAAAAALALARRAAPPVRYGIACAALAAMALAPAATWAWSRAGGAPAPAACSVAEPPPRGAGSAPGEPLRNSDTFVAAIDALDALDAPDAPDALEPGAPADRRAWTAWLAAGWCLGVVVLGIRALGGWLGLLRLRRVDVGPLPASLQATLAELARRLGIDRPLRAVESRLVAVPAVAGWWRPLILVPCSALARLSPDQLEAVLAHELAHIRRHDYLVNLLQTAVEVLLFFHPAVWWLSRRIREERELCCDDVAAEVCGDPVRYARALAELEGCRHPARLALGFGGGELILRVRRLLGLPAKRRLLSPARAAEWALGLGVIAGLAPSLLPPEALADEPPLVAVSSDGRLVQVPAGVAVVLRDARGARTRDGGLLLVVAPDQRLDVIGSGGRPAGPGTRLGPGEQLAVSTAEGRRLWTFSCARRGGRAVVELSHHDAAGAPFSPRSPFPSPGRGVEDP